MKHIVIFRTSGSYIDYNTYNCQELGLAKALTKRGYNVSLILGGKEEKRVHMKCLGGGISIYYLKYKGIHQAFSLFLGWKKLLNELKPDVIQVHDFTLSMSILVAKWAKQSGIKCVLIQGNYETTKKKPFKWVEKGVNKLAGVKELKNVDKIGCKTIFAEKYIQSYCKRSTFLTPIGLDEKKFKSLSGTESKFRLEHNLEGKHILLYIGKMEKRRNPLFLLKLMQTLPEDYCLVLVGDGPQHAEVQAYIQKYNLKNVLTLGKKSQEELPAIYAASDLFLLASDYEIFGMVILESMYFGVPVISTLTAGSATLIDKDCGCIIPDYAVQIWTNIITELCQDSDKLSKMKQTCLSRIREHYVWDKAVDKFIPLYEEE